MATYPGCTTDGSWLPAATKITSIMNIQKKRCMILTYRLFYTLMLSSVTKRKCRSFLYNMYTFLPLAASEQDAKTACTDENFSSSRTLCPSSKPSSWRTNREKWIFSHENAIKRNSVWSQDDYFHFVTKNAAFRGSRSFYIYSYQTYRKHLCHCLQVYLPLTAALCS